MGNLSAAKWSYLTRRVTNVEELRLGAAVRKPQLGDLVVAQVVRVGAHDHLENVKGRRACLYEGDLIVGAYGNRYATDFFEGYLPSDTPVHLLTAGGLMGTVASAHVRRDEPTELRVVGALVDKAGLPLSLEDYRVPEPLPATPSLGTVVVVGSSMNSGKTTTAVSMVRGLSLAGMKVGAAKVTGSGSGKDHWAYLDAGAAVVTDFIDFGMSSTFGYPIERLASVMTGMRDLLAGAGAEVVVMEVADGLLQEDTRGLAARLPGFADHVLLAVGDALGAIAGIEVLTGVGVRVGAISGLITASPLASREAEVTGLPVLTSRVLAEGAAVDLLAGVIGPTREPASPLPHSDIHRGISA